MTSFTVVCECGERFHGGDGSAGRRVRCRRCNRVVELEPPRFVEPPAQVERRPKRRRRSGGFRKLIAAQGAALRARLVAAFRKTLRRRVARTQRVRRTSRPVRVLQVLAWTYLAATLGVAIAMWGFGDRFWPATILLFMGRWIFLLPLVVLAPVALLLQRRLLLPLVLAALTVVGPVMGGRAGVGRLLQVPDGMPLRVVTFNVGGGQAMIHDLALLLEIWSADVVLFQECGERLAAMSKEARGWNAHHAGPLCMMTRFPIVAAEPMDRSALERVKQDAEAGIGGAGYVARYTLATPSGPITVVNLHLETARKGFEGLMDGDVEQLRLNTRLRNLESSLARRWTDAGRGPTIIAGDFNTPVESRIFQQHWGDFADAFTRAGVGFGQTKYNGWIRIRIDHVLTDDAWRAVKAWVWRDIGSDHRAMVADLVLVGR